MGGIDVRVYHAQHPDEVAGLVLVDPSTEESAEGERAALARLRGAAAAHPHPLGARPLVVLTPGTGATRERVEVHARAAGLSTNARHTVVAGAGHEIHLEEPAAVAGAVQDVVDAVRTGKPLRPAANGSLVDAAAERVTFPTDLYGEGDRGVVLVHGGRLNKESWATQGRALARAGFRALASTCAATASRRDPQARTRWARHRATATWPRPCSTCARPERRRSRPWGQHGRRRGGGGGLAPRSNRSPGADGGHPDGPAEKLSAPTLFLMARDDRSADGLRLPGLRAYYDKAPEPKELIILDGSAHAQFLFESDQAERVLREILRFLSAP
jgi:pimeloyl-ACP methyl ester carboxylesterase